MSDELNVTQPEVVDSVSSEVVSQETTENTTPQETQQETKAFKVKHLHEEKEISYDEAPTYIQKGLDYDRIKGRYEETKPVYGFVEKLAQQNNMTVPEYLQAVENQQRQEEIESIANERNLDPDLAEEVYLLRQERAERENINKQRSQDELILKDFQDLTSISDIKTIEDVPKEVWSIKQNNPHLSLSDAYIRYDRDLLKTKLSAQETNRINAESSTGSVTGNGSAKSVDLTPEIIEGMTDKERMARWPEIKKVLGMK